MQFEVSTVAVCRVLRELLEPQFRGSGAGIGTTCRSVSGYSRLEFKHARVISEWGLLNGRKGPTIAYFWILRDWILLEIGVR